MADARPELSVIIPSYKDAKALSACLDLLRAQSLDASRFQVLVADDGNQPPLEASLLDGFPHGRLVRQSNAGPAAARNMALRHVRAPITVLLNADAVPPDNLLEKHLQLHSASPEPRALLGRFDWLPEHRSSFVDYADSANVLFAYHLLTPGEPVEPWACWTGNFSLPTKVLRDVGGFDESYRRALFEDVELGYRLVARGVPIVFHPELRCGHDHAFSIDAWERRAEWKGHEWVRFARKHGGAAFSILGGEDEPTQAWATELLGGWLHQFDQHPRRIAELKELCAELDSLDLNARRERAGAEAERARALIVGINTCAIMSGIVGGILGYTPDDRRRHAMAMSQRRAVVHSIAYPEDIGRTQRLLDVLPDNTELVVTHAQFLSSSKFPDDKRITLVRLPSATPDNPFEPFLRHTEADAFVLVEAQVIPTRRELETLFRFLGASPRLGALGLGRPQGRDHATSTLMRQIPTATLGVPRASLSGDSRHAVASGSFLDRLDQRGLYKAVLALAGG